MTNKQFREIVITTTVAATVSAVTSSLVAIAINRLEAKVEEQKLAAREQNVTLREYYMAEAMKNLMG